MNVNSEIFREDEMVRLLIKLLPCCIFLTFFSIENYLDAACTSRFPMVYESKDNTTFIIGGMFPIHYYSPAKERYTINLPGIAWIEAMLFAIEEINSRKDVLPNLTLGYKIYDSCGTVNRTLESALQVLEGFSEYGDGFNCSSPSHFKRAIAVIGSASSQTNYKLAAITRASQTTHISYSSTSTDLTAGHLYPHFMRTIPPDNIQAHVMAALLRHFNWTYVNIIAMDDKYGRAGAMNLLREFKRNNICVKVKEIYDITNESNRTTHIIHRLKNEKEATSTVLWCDHFHAMQILREAQRHQLHHRTWIATEALGNSNELFTLDKRVVQGMFGVVPYQKKSKAFVERLRLTSPNNSDPLNPWLKEYWEDEKGCNKTLGTNYYRCPTENVDLTLLPINKHRSVMDAVYAVAYGLQNYLDEVAQNTSHHDLINTSKLSPFVKKMSFVGEDGVTVSFDDDGNPTSARYHITNLRYNTSTKEYNLVHVGTWEAFNITSAKLENISTFIMNASQNIQFANFSSNVPRSSCADSCAPGHKGVIFGDTPCCWKCVRCPSKQVQPLPYQFNCTECTDGLVANLNQSHCIKPLVQQVRIDSLPGGILLFLVIICYVLLIASIVVMYRNKATAVMNASNTQLCWIQLLSFLFLLAFPLSFFYPVTTILTCRLRHYYFICFYTIVLSITFTKADRLLRVFNAGKIGILRHRERSNRFQLIMVACLTVLGLLLVTFVHYSLKMKVEGRYKNISNNIIHVTYYCAGNHDTHLLVVIGYIQCIALICGVYAFKARDLPETFNEARYTSFAMFSFVLLWMMFVPVHFSTKSWVDQCELWGFMSLGVTVELFVLMYLKKLYVIQFRPDLNTREHVAGEIKAFNLALSRKSDGSEH